MYFCAFSGCSRVATNEEKEEGRKKGKKKDKGEIEAREIQMHHALMFPMNVQSTFMCHAAASRFMLRKPELSTGPMGHWARIKALLTY